MTDTTCVEPGCDKPILIKKRGWCEKHYRAWRKYGDPNFVKTRSFPSASELILRKVDRSGRPDACWPYLGALNRDGYGEFRGGNFYMAHRAMYETLVGPIPDGLALDHLCRNRACCNPAHLEPVTTKTNTLRGIGFAAVNAVKTHCKYGHEYTAENTHITPKGERLGRTCSIEWQRQNRSKTGLPKKRLPDETVREIRRLVSEGERPSAVARRFDLAQSIVWHITSGRSYRTVGEA